jgi:sugar lactone lactonase YvrE
VRVQIDSRGNVLVLDSKTRRIVRVGETGRFGGFLTPSGVPGGERWFPVSFRLDGSDRVYVLDGAAARVVVLEPDGAFARELPAPPGAALSDLAVDARGTVVAIDGRHARVYAAAPDARTFAPLGTGLREVASYPTSVALSDRGLIVLVDGHGNGLVVLAPDGTYLGRRLGIGWTEGLVYYPGQICIDARGDVFVADRGNHRVQAFTQAR